MVDIMEGENVEIEDDDPDVEDTEDGGAIVRLDDEDEGPKPGDSDFYENLAEGMSDGDLNSLSTRFLELLDRDKEARKKRDEQYEEGIRRTGLGDDAPGGAQFQGASRVVHPMLTEVCVDFSSRAIKELFPPDGPVKSKIVGEVTKERMAKADRKTDFMNLQLTTQCQEFRSELEQLLTQVPLGGAQYMKTGWRTDRNRPEFTFIAIDDILLPYAASNFYSAQRKTHVQYITSLEYDEKVDLGVYRDVDMVPTSMLPDQTDAAKANDKVEGRSDNTYNEDGLRTVYEVYAVVDIKDDPLADGAAPYIITIDKVSTQVMSIYRNWDEDDASREAMEWIVEFPFVPWRGAYPIGITHMIGGLSGAATGALRALLDSAHIQNSQTMLKLKGGSAGGQSLELQPTQVMEIEGGLNVDDIRKLAMPLPYNPPSATLFQLLGFLVDAGKGVVRTTMDDISDSNQNVPVGTTLAKIEQGMVVFSAIHARLHNAMQRLLRILNRLNGMYLDDEMIEKEFGSDLVKRADFDGPLDVVPVSDPNIFSEAQRFAQMQAVAQRAQLMPQLYDLRKVEERILKTLKIPDALGLLAPRQTPTEENAVSENVKASLGQPVVAFPDQDHIAHLKAHLAFMVNPNLGASKLIAPQFLPVMLGHIKEHMVLWYASEAFRLMDDHADFDVEQAMKDAQTPEDKKAFDTAVGEAAINAGEGADAAFGETMPSVIAQAMDLLQKLTPPMPQDPMAAAAMQDIQMRAKASADKVALEGQKAQLKQQLDTVQLQLNAKNDSERIQQENIQQQHEDARAHEDAAVRERMNTEDNETALKIADMQVERGGNSSISTGNGINP